MADEAVLKDLTIKTGVVKRLIKEICCYEKEVQSEEQQLQELKAKGDADEYVIKKRAEVLRETEEMIPRCTRRLIKSVEDLKQVIEQHESVLQGTPQYEAANEQIKASSEYFSKSSGKEGNQ